MITTSKNIENMKYIIHIFKIKQKHWSAPFWAMDHNPASLQYFVWLFTEVYTGVQRQSQASGGEGALTKMPDPMILFSEDFDYCGTKTKHCFGVFMRHAVTARHKSWRPFPSDKLIVVMTK